MDRFERRTPRAWASGAPGKVSTVLGLGATWALNPRISLLAHWGEGLENRAQTGRSVFYAGLLAAF